MNVKRLLLAFLFTMPLCAQITYSVSKTTALSSSAEVVTVQQPATGAQVVRFISAYVDSTAACSITIERNAGPAATSAALTPVPANPEQAASIATAYSSSNVGTGSVITRAGIAAGGYVIVDLSHVYLRGNGVNKNLTVRTGSCTGTVNIDIVYTESAQ